MSAFTDAVKDSFDAIAGVIGCSVTYHRGNAWVRIDDAVPGNSDHSAEGSPVILENRTRDFIVRTESLNFGGSRFLPQRGDSIKQTIAGTVYTYRVHQPDGASQPWRYSDSEQSRIRVHTILGAA